MTLAPLPPRLDCGDCACIDVGRYFVHPDYVQALEARLAAVVREQTRLREALKAVNTFVTGEAMPNWPNIYHVTVSRGAVADLCGAALSQTHELPEEQK